MNTGAPCIILWEFCLSMAPFKFNLIGTCPGLWIYKIFALIYCAMTAPLRETLNLSVAFPATRPYYTARNYPLLYGCQQGHCRPVLDRFHKHFSLILFLPSSEYAQHYISSSQILTHQFQPQYPVLLFFHYLTSVLAKLLPFGTKTKTWNNSQNLARVHCCLIKPTII